MMKTGKRYATKLRDNEIKELYRKMVGELGEVAKYVSKDYYYEKLNKLTGLSKRTLSDILNRF